MLLYDLNSAFRFLNEVDQLYTRVIGVHRVHLFEYLLLHTTSFYSYLELLACLSRIIFDEKLV